MGISEIFKLDNIDKEIISMLQDDPNITHSKIAKEIGRSQPAVGSRIHKLQEKGIISSQIGVNFKNTKIYLSKIEMATRNPEEIWEMASYCPFVINCMKQSGELNVLLFLASSNLKKLDNIVDYHFRNNDDISKIQMDIVTDFAKDFILPVDFEMDTHEPIPGEGCNSCKRKNKLNI